MMEDFDKQLKIIQKKLIEVEKAKKEIERTRKEIGQFYAESKTVPLDVPYIPSTQNKIEKMIELADIKEGQRAIDLGSGDGRIVIALAEAGAKAFGYEIEPERVKLAKKNIENKGLSKKAFIFEKNFLKANYETFDVITIYGLTSIMDKLEEKLKKELKPGARVVSNSFMFPHWKPDREVENIYLYIKPIS